MQDKINYIIDSTKDLQIISCRKSIKFFMALKFEINK
jgi:hypothetical protein